MGPRGPLAYGLRPRLWLLFTLSLENKEVSKHETLLYVKHFLSLRHVNMTALKNEWLIFLKMAFRGFRERGPWTEMASTGLNPAWRSPI